jgi:hypothetical protein
MRTTAAPSHSAQDWRKQSHADGRHAEYDAQLPRDCRPPLRATNRITAASGCVFVVVARRDCGSTAQYLQAIIAHTRPRIFCLLGVR